MDFEGVFLDCLKQVVEQSRVNWDLVVQTDEKPREGDWDKLMILVARAMPLVEQEFLRAEKPLLMIYPDLLAQYDQMAFLGEISQKVGRRGGIPGLWLLVPGDRQALVNGKPIPLIGPGQRARIPESWLRNLHRANGNSSSQRSGNEYEQRREPATYLEGELCRRAAAQLPGPKKGRQGLVQSKGRPGISAQGNAALRRSRPRNA